MEAPFSTSVNAIFVEIQLAYFYMLILTLGFILLGRKSATKVSPCLWAAKVIPWTGTPSCTLDTEGDMPQLTSKEAGQKHYVQDSLADTF
jgi:hypothetical protein